MPSSYTLGKHFEDFIKAQLATGRYNNASEVIRAALRLMEEDERKWAPFDASIQAGLDDFAAGRFRDAEDVFDELIAELDAMADQTAE